MPPENRFQVFRRSEQGLPSISHQVQVFEELTSDAHPARIEGHPEATIGQFEDGPVGFRGVQDRNVPAGLRALGLSLQAGQAESRDGQWQNEQA